MQVITIITTTTIRMYTCTVETGGAPEVVGRERGPHRHRLTQRRKTDFLRYCYVIKKFRPHSTIVIDLVYDTFYIHEET